MKRLIVILTALLTACSGFQGSSNIPVYEQYDSEFLYWCKAEDGETWPVYLAEPPECPSKDVSRGEWDHYPLTVNADDSLVLESLEAVEAFNAQLGFELFKFEHTNYDPDVTITDGGINPFLYAVAKHVTDEGRDYGLVLTYNDLGSEDRSDVIMHELGHIVGLRHDRYNPKSVMYHSDGLRVHALERQDIAALRRIYLR